MKISLPKEIKLIFNVFHQNGFEAFAVGGCIRDSLMGIMPRDWDIATDALPQKVKQLFEGNGFKVIPTGIVHGTVTVIVDGSSVEVTTYRIESNYSDNRRPDSVEFSKDLKTDLERRDFTINAMAYNPLCGLVDIFGGLEDLNKGIIRCVGNADERFQEDALRMLRGIRFCSQLDFGMEFNTFVCIMAKKHLLDNISRERIRDEINSILLSPNAAKGIDLLAWSGLLEIVFSDYYIPVSSHTLRAIDFSNNDLIIRLAVILHQTTLDVASKMLKGLRYDNDTINRVCKLIGIFDTQLHCSKPYIKRQLNKYGVDVFSDFLKAKKACLYAGDKFNIKNKLEQIDKVSEVVKNILDDGECFSLKQLEITGQDIIDMGLAPGPEVGHVLGKLLDKVIQQPECNKRDVLIQMAAGIIKET
ncbi:MAG: CCA tRNA nucleotidyltransferase [Clostridia bacterium]|nr:CCA tRNA nucleotidyltransferase [Clostridia bacterium]